MAKKMAIGTVAVFVLWEVLDFIGHGNLLMGLYAESASMWRPEGEMKMGLLALVVLISAATFTYVYVALISPKSMATAVKYGAVFGLGAATTFAYGHYAVQPVPYMLALGWFLLTLVEGAAAGVVLGFLVKD